MQTHGPYRNGVIYTGVHLKNSTYSHFRSKNSFTLIAILQTYAFPKMVAYLTWHTHYFLWPSTLTLMGFRNWPHLPVSTSLINSGSDILGWNPLFGIPFRVAFLLLITSVFRRIPICTNSPFFMHVPGEFYAVCLIINQIIRHISHRNNLVPPHVSIVV